MSNSFTNDGSFMAQFLAQQAAAAASGVAGIGAAGGSSAAGSAAKGKGAHTGPFACGYTNGRSFAPVPDLLPAPQQRSTRAR